MKILITGATGFIGKELALKLHQAGHEIVCLTRNIQTAQKKLPFPCSYHEWKNFETPPPQTAFKNVSVVFNLAGESIIRKRWSKSFKQKLTRSRVQLTQQLALSARNTPSIHTFIQTSAIGFYGDRNSEPLDENSHEGKDFLAQLCSSWEKAAKNFETENKRLIIFRLGLVLSPKRGILKKILPLFKWGLGGRMGSGRQWISWIHLEDLICLFQKGMENQNWKGVFNAVSPTPLSHLEWVCILSQAVYRPAWFVLPSFIARLFFGEMSCVFLYSQKVYPVKLQKQGFTYKHSDLNFLNK